MAPRALRCGQRGETARGLCGADNRRASSKIVEGDGRSVVFMKRPLLVRSVVNTETTRATPGAGMGTGIWARWEGQVRGHQAVVEVVVGRLGNGAKALDEAGDDFRAARRNGVSFPGGRGGR